MRAIWRPRKAPTADDAALQSAPPQKQDGFEVPATFLDHAEEGMVLVGDGIVRWMNPAARLLFPSFDSPVGRSLVEVARDHRIEALVKKVQLTGVEQSAEIELPVSSRQLLVRALPGPHSTIALLVQDLTRLRHLEKIRQEFVANLSHELRTPLAGLDLAGQTLADQLPADGDSRLFIDQIIRESQRLQAILQNLNQLAALDAEGIEVEWSRFDVKALLGELSDRYQSGAAAAGLRLDLEVPDPPLEAIGDRAKTEQALQNIVDNALKFTQEGKIVLSGCLDDARVEVSVRDTGPGIPPRELPRIFERFYKVDRARGGKPGSGLGLSIARHLVELQGGAISAESTPGVGTEVKIRLPRAPLISP